ncbi:hypothetical protein JCM24511_03241 [Saitozyma sp. JCM 24511]|nr:hypothetical protein JCM24511_03241 [Saitozyma sp. JCM 24511]
MASSQSQSSAFQAMVSTDGSHLQLPQHQFPIMAPPRSISLADFISLKKVFTSVSNGKEAYLKGTPHKTWVATLDEFEKTDESTRSAVLDAVAQGSEATPRARIFLAVASECATASLDSDAEDALSIMAATLYLRAHTTVAGPTSSEASSGKFEVDSASFEAEYAAEILYGPVQGKDEDTIQRVSRIFEFLNVKKFLKGHKTTKRSRTPMSSRARTPTQEDTSGPATTSTQEAQGQ